MVGLLVLFVIFAFGFIILFLAGKVGQFRVKKLMFLFLTVLIELIFIFWAIDLLIALILTALALLGRLSVPG